MCCYLALVERLLDLWGVWKYFPEGVFCKPIRTRFVFIMTCQSYFVCFALWISCPLPCPGPPGPDVVCFDLGTGIDKNFKSRDGLWENVKAQNHLMTRCQILGPMRLHCVSKTLTVRMKLEFVCCPIYPLWLWACWQAFINACSKSRKDAATHLHLQTTDPNGLLC